MKKFLILLLFLLSLSFNSFGIIRDSEIESLIKEIVSPIAKAAKQNEKNLKIFIINDDQVNAFVTPGQKMFIFSGLIINTKNTNEIEGVIAHELGHITGKHHIKIYETLEKSRVISVVGLILGGAVQVLSGDPNAAAAIAGGALSTAERSILSFSRVQEGAADQAGVEFLKKSNKSICGIINFLEFLQNQQVGYQKNAYTQSHPLTIERINDAKYAARNEDCSNNKKEKTNKKYGLTIEERYKFIQTKIIAFNNPENALISLESNNNYNEDQKKYGLSIANYKSFNLIKANGLINELIEKYPLNPFFYELKAQMLRENGQLKEALNNYQKVSKLLPNDPLIQIELAHTLINLNSNKTLNSAIKKLEKAKIKEINNDKLWYLLSVAYGRNSEMGKSKYASAYSFYLKGDDTMALSFIERAKKITLRDSDEWNKIINLENKINLKKNKR